MLAMRQRVVALPIEVQVVVVVCSRRQKKFYDPGPCSRLRHTRGQESGLQIIPDAFEEFFGVWPLGGL